MNISPHFRASCVLLFMVSVLFTISGCKTTDPTLPKQDPIPLLSQNLDSLKSSDGKIVEARRITVDSPWSSSIDIYRIQYLSDDLRIVGFVVKPKNLSSPLPVIIFNRGGNREFSKVNEGTLRRLSYLSSKGYVILASQYRGNDGGQGREQFGGRDVNDVLNMVELAKSLPFVDPERIAMLGYSRGGMMTYLAIKHGADLKAAAVVSGVTDLGKNYNERDQRYRNVIRTLVGTDKTEWEKRSAVYWADLIDVPVLILHGEDDKAVSVQQAITLSEKLNAYSKEHQLVTFRGGDHGLFSHREEKYRRIFDWFERHLNSE